jgi:maltooligosyltrehalose trehalohydrolase
VAKGRAEFLAQFPSIASEDVANLVPDPEAEQTFLRCKLNFADRDRNADVLKLHRDLLRLRKTDSLLGNSPRGTFDGAVLGATALVLRFFGRKQDDRLLVVNLGPQLHLDPAPEPLLAPPLGMLWEVNWSSEDPSYGGGGTPGIDTEENWRLPAESAALLTPVSSP